jgi:hypothetical protein
MGEDQAYLADLTLSKATAVGSLLVVLGFIRGIGIPD